jgi:formylglycine-generating enzyme required for sulfatase activity
LKVVIFAIEINANQNHYLRKSRQIQLLPTLHPVHTNHTMKRNATPLSLGEGLGVRLFLLLATLAPISAQTPLHITHGCAYKTAAEESTLYTFAGSEEVDRIVREIGGGNFNPDTGTPRDTDGDGVPDHKDKCPKDKGEPRRDGCPNEAPVPDNTEISDNMVFIPGGTFQMGSEDGDIEEKPVHTVTVSSFYMSKYELTVAEFKQFIEATGYKTDADKQGCSYVWTGSKYEKKKGMNWRCDVKGNPRPTSEYNHPVIHVSWNDAAAYCQWKSKTTGKNYRLPTEAEWEYAAGGGDPKSRSRTLWAGTSEEGQVGPFANYNGKNGADQYDYTAPVGSLKPNALGLYDMSGNIWEWCSDRYDNYAADAQTNPTGATSGSFRVLRGGGWYFFSRYCRVACRGFDEPDYCCDLIGFRLALQ